MRADFRENYLRDRTIWRLWNPRLLRNFRRSFSTINHNLHFNLPENIINLKLNRLRDLLHRSIDKETGDRKPVEYSTLDGSNYSPRRTPCARARKDGWDGEERKVESRRIEDRAIVWRETRVSTGHDPRPRQGSRGLCLRPRSHRTAPVMHLAIDFLLALVALSLSLSLSSLRRMWNTERVETRKHYLYPSPSRCFTSLKRGHRFYAGQKHGGFPRKITGCLFNSFHP